MRTIGETGGRSEENRLKTVVTIDGPAGSGKSTVAGVVATRLGFFLLDSGGLYRAMALHLLRQGIDPGQGTVPQRVLDSTRIAVEPGIGTMRLFLGDEDVTRIIRDEQISQAASQYSILPEVRRALIQVQRDTAYQWDLVAEGRDMGTVVFPDAAVKFFLFADLEIRAGRRCSELMERGVTADLGQVRSDMEARDRRDRLRRESPLVAAPDAIVVDTSAMAIEDVCLKLLARIHERI